MFRKRVVIVLAVATISTLGAAQVAIRSQSDSAPSDGNAPDAVSILSAEPQRLGQQFRRLSNHAVSPKATAAARREFVAFARGELMSYLSSAVVLYPLADSVGGTGGYAVASALFDGEAIARQVKELERLTGPTDVAAFRARTLVLGELLDVYFTKERLLVAPILARLSSDELHAVVAQITAHP